MVGKRMVRSPRVRGWWRQLTNVMLSLLVVAAGLVPSIIGQPIIVRAASSAGTWQNSATTGPSARTGASMAYDTATGTELLFGGWTGTAAQADTWSWSGSAWTKLSPSTSPSARYNASMAFDSVHNQVVLFGGNTGSSALNDTWLWNGTTWSSPSVHKPPSARSGASMVFDTARQQIVMFGGANGTTLDSDTWTWNGSSWTQLSPSTSPPARSAASMAFDPTTGTSVLFGGSGSSGTLGDAWSWNGTTWSSVSVSGGPSARTGAGLAYDAASGLLTLFGGKGGADLADTWTWNGSAWAQLSPAASPSARDSLSIANQDSSGTIVLFGGANGGTFDGDTWTWTTAPAAPTGVAATAAAGQATVSWTAPIQNGGAAISGYTVLSTPDGATATAGASATSATVTGLRAGIAYTFVVGASNSVGLGLASAPSSAVTTYGGSASTAWLSGIGTAPSARVGAAMAYDAATGTEVLFGGSQGGTAQSDTWTWNGSAWTKQTPATSPGARYNASIAYDAAHQQVVLFGGISGSTALSDTWVWNGTTWTQKSVSTFPSARSAAGMVYDSVRQQVVLFGGVNGSTFSNETWVWNGSAWTKLTPATSPGARSAAAMAFDTATGLTVLFGGAASGGASADTWTWNGTTWSPLSPGTSPPARSAAGSAYDAASGLVVLFGGKSGGDLADTWTFNGTTWAQLAPASWPSARDGLTLAAQGSTGSAVLFGGETGSAMLGDTWTWTTPPSAPTSISATAGVNQATVSWAAPALSGASAITGYTVTSSPDGQTATAGASATSATVSGLRPGISYTFAVVAANAIGAGLTGASGAVTTPTAPGAPTGVSATGGNTQATVNWTAPSSGGSPITGYVITPFIGTTAQTPSSAGASATSLTVTGLTNGTAYTFRVAATNAVGTGPVGTSNAVTPATTPSAPVNVTATPGNAQATVAWSAPTTTGGSAITGYTVTPYIGTTAQTPVSVGGSTTSTMVTGLTNGTAYTFAVTATNGVGTGPAATSSAVTPATVPGAPTNVTGTPGDGQVTLSWTTPASNGGSAITGYTITPYQGSTALSPTTTSGPGTQVTVFGLTDGTAYTFTVAASNAVGTGAAATSAAVTPAGVPGAPINVSATGGNAQATVTWGAPAANGSAITGYTITPYIGTTAQPSVTAGPTATSVTVSNLANGTTYTFAVVATNGVGNGPSASSNAVTPATVPSAPANVTAVAGNAQATVSWFTPTTTGGSAITGYVVTPYVGTTAQTPWSVGPSATSLTVTGLVNGTAYSFTVAATNAIGTGPTGASGVVVPVTVPGAPNNVSAVPGNASATVSWLPPSSNGGTAITGYTVTPYIGSTAQTATSVAATITTATITGLTNNTTYTFSVIATNAVGNGPATSSSAVTPDAYAGTILGDHPLAYYRLDEASGTTAADSSGNASNATYSPGVTYSAPGALLNASDPAVSLASSATVTDPSLSSLSGSQASTTEFWYKVPSSAYSAGTIDVISDASVYLEFQNGGATLVVGPGYFSNHSFTLPYPVNDGQWHLFDVESDGGNYCTVYMDGGSLGTQGGYNNCSGNGSHAPVLSIGNWNGDGTAGSFDEVAVYPSQLSATRIAARWTLAATQLNQVSLCPPTPTSQYASDVLSDHPDAYLRLDELASKPTQRVAFDSSGLCSTGNPTNGSYSPGSVISTSGGLANDSNTAATISAATASIRDGAATLPAWNQPSTTEFWFKVAAAAYGSGSLDLLADPSLYLQLQNGGTTLSIGPGFEGNRTFSLPYAVNDGQWHLFDVTNDGGNYCTVYFDGSSIGSQGGYYSCGGSTVYGPGLIIGNYAGGDVTAGSFDEVAVYPSQLTATRVADHWARGGTPLNQATLCPPTPGSAYARSVLSDSPGTYLRLDELSSAPTRRVAFDSSGHCTSAAPTDGTYEPSAATSAPGAPVSDTGSGVTLASANSRIRDTASSVPGANQPSTLEFWYKVSAQTYSSGSLDLVTTPSMYVQLQNGGTTLAVGPGYFSNHSFALPYPVNDGQWHLIDVVEDNGNYCTFYLDGGPVGTQGGYNNCGGQGPYGPGLIIGNFSGGSDVTAGSFDDMAVYPTQLSAVRIAAHYGSGAPIGGPVTPAQSAGGGSNYCFPCHGNEIRHGNITSFPVDTATGNFWHIFSDIEIPGRGMSLGVDRTYNSSSASTNGPLGYGWQLNQGMALAVGGTSPNEVATIVQENGSQVTFNQPSSGSSWAPSAPRFNATLTQNGDGTWTFVRQASETFTFSAAGQLARAVDLNGNATTYSYTGSTLTGISDAAGRSLTLGWTGSHITSVTDANGAATRVAQYEYDGNGNLSDVFDVGGNHWQFAYDASHRLTTMKDPNCLAAGSACPGVVNVYDSQGRVISQSDPLGRTTLFDYTSISGATKSTDPSGHVVVDYYSYGLRTATTRGYGTPQAATSTFGYDPATLALTSVTDPNGHVTTYTVDASGNVLTTTDALGRQDVKGYNSLNEVLTDRDPLGVTTTRTYDAAGNLLSQSRPDTANSTTATTSYYYDAPTHPGDVTRVVDPDGKTWHYTYDQYGAALTATDPLGNETITCHDPIGWPTWTVSPRGSAGLTPSTVCAQAASQETQSTQTPPAYTTVMSYLDPRTGHLDPYGLVHASTNANGNTTTQSYDADQNPVSVTTALNKTANSVYDAANELTQSVRGVGTSQQSTLTTDYNPDGTVHDQVDGAGGTTVYGYDSLGRVVSVTTPTTTACSGGCTTSYTYDAAGNRLTQQDPGGNCSASPAVGCTTDTYDAGNELTAFTYSDGVTPNVSNITYDVDGQRTAMTDGTGTSSWTWDSLHRMTSSTDGTGKTVDYSYDLAGHTTAITYPGQITPVRQTFDDAGRLQTIADWLGNTTTFAYDANSNRTSEVFPTGSGSTDTFVPDAANNLMAITDAQGSNTLVGFTYTRDGAGQVTSEVTSGVSALGQQPSRYVGYTALNQVCVVGATAGGTCLSPGSGATGYAYDAADNLVAIGSSTQAYDAANELCWTGSASGSCASPPAGATSYSYDQRGNRTTTTSGGATTTMTYDEASRLTAFGQAAGYAYNGDGLRMSKTVGGVSEPFVWNTSGALPLMLQDGGTSFVYGPGGLPLEQISSSGTPLYYHQDQLGSTRMLTDASGNVQATYTYDAYGNVSSHTGAATTPLQYAAQYTDAESGLQYLRARYYDPSTAEFLSRDPAVATTRSPYGYVAGNPLNGADPSGLCWGPDWLCGVENTVVTVAEAPVALAHSELLTAESVVSTAFYAPYWASYEINKYAPGEPFSPVFSAVEHVFLPLDQGFDMLQQWSGYPDAQVGDEGGASPNVVPSLIYPTPCSGGGWRQNKEVFGPTGDDVLNSIAGLFGKHFPGGPGPGRHSNGQEDYN